MGLMKNCMLTPPSIQPTGRNLSLPLTTGFVGAATQTTGYLYYFGIMTVRVHENDDMTPTPISEDQPEMITAEKKITPTPLIHSI